MAAGWGAAAMGWEEGRGRSGGSGWADAHARAGRQAAAGGPCPLAGRGPGAAAAPRPPRTRQVVYLVDGELAASQEGVFFLQRVHSGVQAHPKVLRPAVIDGARHGACGGAAQPPVWARWALRAYACWWRLLEDPRRGRTQDDTLA